MSSNFESSETKRKVTVTLKLDKLVVYSWKEQLFDHVFTLFVWTLGYLPSPKQAIYAISSYRGYAATSLRGYVAILRVSA